MLANTRFLPAAAPHAAWRVLAQLSQRAGPAAGVSGARPSQLQCEKSRVPGEAGGCALRTAGQCEADGLEADGLGA